MTRTLAIKVGIVNRRYGGANREQYFEIIFKPKKLFDDNTIFAVNLSSSIIGLSDL